MTQQFSLGTRRTAPRATVTTPSSGLAYRFAVASDGSTWPGRDGEHPGLLALPEEAQLEGFDRLTEDGAALVVVCGPREAAAVHRASAIARSRSQARVAVVPVHLGPLGQQAMARIGAELVASPTGRTAVEIIEWLPDAAGLVLDLAVLSSVATLDQLEVPVGNHLLGYLPGRRTFVAQVSPGRAVVRVNRVGELRPASAALALPAFDDTYATSITVMGERQVPDVVLRACRTSSAPARLPSTPALRQFWGDVDATEVVVVPSDLPRWARAVLPPATAVPCAWCHEPLAAATTLCPLCGNLVSRRA